MTCLYCQVTKGNELKASAFKFMEICLVLRVICLV
jgi:hypothetical protein